MYTWLRRLLTLFVPAFAAICVLAGLQRSVAATDPWDGCGGIHTTTKHAHKNSGSSLIPADCLLPVCHTINQHASYHHCENFPVYPYTPVCTDYEGVIQVDNAGNLSACPVWMNDLVWN